eukprot:7071420-Lingulodinium_polyedra.AAC.1
MTEGRDLTDVHNPADMTHTQLPARPWGQGEPPAARAPGEAASCQHRWRVRHLLRQPLTQQRCNAE